MRASEGRWYEKTNRGSRFFRRQECSRAEGAYGKARSAWTEAPGAREPMVCSDGRSARVRRARTGRRVARGRKRPERASRWFVPTAGGRVPERAVERAPVREAMIGAWK